MAEYIVDTAIVIQELIQEPHTQYVRRLFSGLVASDKLHVPEFCLVECTNVLWKRARFEGLSQSDAETLVADLSSLPLTLDPIDEVLTRALQIGLAHQLAIYDSIYIALAEKYAYPLITADAKQAAAAQTVGVTLKPITDF